MAGGRNDDDSAIGALEAENAALRAEVLATVKHPGFLEEKEWRLVAAFRQYQQGPNPFDTNEPPLFRNTDMAIVPYIEVPFPKSAIVSIRVGPGKSSDVRAAGVRRLLNSLGSVAQHWPYSLAEWRVGNRASVDRLGTRHTRSDASGHRPTDNL